jgi:uncharacterized protein YdeI (YjbR/CyaY-like superfamily)
MEIDDEPRTIEVPADLEQAMAGNEKAKAAFEKLSYTHRREYVEWILEAKKADTRARRIARTIEALAIGKSR